MNKRKECPGHYYGLKAIAAKLGCSIYSVQTKILKYRFPAFRIVGLNSCGGHGYCWYSNDDLINQWWNMQVLESREFYLRTKTARNMGIREDDNYSIQDKSGHRITTSVVNNQTCSSD